MWTFIFKEMGTRLNQLEHEEREKIRKIGYGYILIWHNAIIIDLIIRFESHGIKMCSSEHVRYICRFILFRNFIMVYAFQRTLIASECAINASSYLLKLF